MAETVQSDSELMLTEAELGYFAGLIDGEGSISLVKKHANRTRGRYVYPLVRVANTDGRLIDWLHTRMPGALQYRTAMNLRCKNVHHIGWACGDAINILRMIEPYLVIKADRARIAIELWETSEKARSEAGGYFGNGHPLPDWLVAYRETAFNKMISLNMRGVSHAA